jgi:hypothetical protein
MRITNELGRFIDSVLPVDTGSVADDEQILSNIMYGLSGFMAYETFKFVEQGHSVFSNDTLLTAVTGIALTGAGVYFREKSHRSANEE